MMKRCEQPCSRQLLQPGASTGGHTAFDRRLSVAPRRPLVEPEGGSKQGSDPRRSPLREVSWGWSHASDANETRRAPGRGAGHTSRLLGSRASVAVFDALAPRRERAETLVWAARFPRASYPTVCGQKFRARRRSRRQKSSFSARLLRQPLTVERRSHAPGRPPQHGRALPDHALGRSLCYWRRFW